jgi:hypothetical protein
VLQQLNHDAWPLLDHSVLNSSPWPFHGTYY